MTHVGRGWAVTVAFLERPLYEMRQVDTLMRVGPGTARRWIDGYRRGGRDYPPVIREASTRSAEVTWGEFVEAQLLAAYRSAGVSILQMRPIVEALRERFGVRYPLAHVEPWVDSGMALVYQAQDDVNLDPDLRLVIEAASGQLRLTAPAERFKRVVSFGRVSEDPEAPEVVTMLRPAGRESPVVIDPERQFGQPVVRSVPTDVLAGMVLAGDDPASIAEWYDLTEEQVRAAVEFEASLTAAA